MRQITPVATTQNTAVKFTLVWNEGYTAQQLHKFRDPIDTTLVQGHDTY